MNKKVLSINLWYEKYGNKTKAQLKSFRRAGFDSYVAEMSAVNNGVCLHIHKLTTNQDNIKETIEELVLSRDFKNYRKAFDFLFSYCEAENFSLIYIRRLMSKLLYCADLINKVNNKIPVVYEIPTYPLDTGNGILYKIRDIAEMAVYKCFCHNLTLVNLIDSINIPNNWKTFHNAIDIDNYDLYPVPEYGNTLNMLIVANIAEYHNYERIIDSIYNYKGDVSVHLSIVSPETNTYLKIKEKINKLGLSEIISTYENMSLDELNKFAKDFHIGIAQLSTSKKGSNIVNTLKTKDYCAMGLPFVSTCFDTSFDRDFPYSYITKNMDDEIDLSEIIKWYSNISKDNEYRAHMYQYAKDNLQFDTLIDDLIQTFSL